MTDTHIVPHCLHAELVDDVHAFTFVRASHRAVNEWMEHLKRVSAQLPDDCERRYLIEVQTNIIPIFDFVVHRLRQYLASASRRVVLVAIVYSDPSQAAMIQQLVHILKLSHAAVHYFPSGRRDEAMRWLTADASRPRERGNNNSQALYS